MPSDTDPPWAVLPGRVDFSDGTRRDYEFLQRYHYRQRPPATWAKIRIARYVAPGEERGKLVGVAVLSYPVPMLRARLHRFGLYGQGYGRSLRFANRFFLTISRVVVHPQFRTLGIAAELVRQLIDFAPTRYVEASAAMGDFANFLKHAGMKRMPRSPDAGETEPAYFVFDKRKARDD